MKRFIQHCYFELSILKSILGQIIHTKYNEIIQIYINVCMLVLYKYKTRHFRQTTTIKVVESHSNSRHKDDLYYLQTNSAL